MSFKNLTKKQLEEIRKKIRQEEECLVFNGVYLSEQFNLKVEDLSDDVDFANAATANAQQLRFRNRENFYRRKLRDARMRIEKGIYGFCEYCGGSIGFVRLMARPTAELCIACKEEAEKGELESIYGQRSKSLGDGPEAVFNLQSAL